MSKIVKFYRLTTSLKGYTIVVPLIDYWKVSKLSPSYSYLIYIYFSGIVHANGVVIWFQTFL